MGPCIILDKSSLQSLSKDELFFLFRHYIVNIPPVLVYEIIGDLKKDTKECTISKDLVVSLSRKITQQNSKVNAHYLYLVEGDLLGYKVTMDGRPIVSEYKAVKSSDGDKGVIIIESSEEKVIRNWQEGKFSEVDKALAGHWRKITKNIDLNNFKKDCRHFFGRIPNLNSFKNLKDFINKLMSRSDIQFDLLNWMFIEFHVKQEIRKRALQRWESDNHTSFEKFSPYAYYCFKINLAFYFGLSEGIIGTRTTNRIDMKYLYYLPFCNVFTTRDNFQKSFSKLFLKVNQDLVDGNELKSDLQKISFKWDRMWDYEKRERQTKYGFHPFEDEDSITYQLWKKYMPPRDPKSFDKTSTMTKEEHDKLLKYVLSKKDSVKSMDKDEISNFTEEDANFMFIERKIWPNSQCFCGSGKTFKDCHGKEL